VTGRVGTTVAAVAGAVFFAIDSNGALTTGAGAETTGAVGTAVVVAVAVAGVLLAIASNGALTTVAGYAIGNVFVATVAAIAGAAVAYTGAVDAIVSSAPGFYSLISTTELLAGSTS